MFQASKQLASKHQASKHQAARSAPARAASRHRYQFWRVLLPLFFFLFACNGTGGDVPAGPTAADANLALLGQMDRLAPGSEANFLVQVRNPYANEAAGNQAVQVALTRPDGVSQTVFAGHTDDLGVVNVKFPVPESVGEYGGSAGWMLDIQAERAGGGGDFHAYQDVYVGRAYNVLLSTDKPVYQPGQVIHMRGLALDTLDLTAADNLTMTLMVADPAGNRLLRREFLTSSFGIAAADFPLDSQAPSGDYVITAELGPTISTRTVEVKPYTLPRFEVKFQPDSTFYLPGETASGKVEARYFFGKPVADAKVVIRGTVTDVSEVTVLELEGHTDADGVYAYSFPVPDYFVGKLDNKTATIDLAVEVTDTANHQEQIDESVTVAEKPLLVEAAPESGRLRTNLDDLVYFDVTYPDGVAAQATLTITDAYSGTFVAQTDVYGLAVITLTTPNKSNTFLQVEATDAAGHRVVQPLVLGTEKDKDGVSVLLRPARPEYRIGDTMNVDIHVAGNVTTAYLDIIKDRQTFGLVALPVVEGVAQAALPIDGSLLGTLELNAYAVSPKGDIVSDRRYVLVNPAPADVTVAADREVYRPGDTATLAIQAQHDGAPLVGAVGLAIVDESVFAVESQDAGFARTYFLINRELQEPRYELHDFVDLDSDSPSPYDDQPDSVRFAERAQRTALNGAFAQALAAEAADRDEAVAAAQQTLVVAQRPDPGRVPWGGKLLLALPLVGLALYDGSLARRRLLIGLVIVTLGTCFWTACASAPAAVPAAAPAAAEIENGATTTATQGQPPPRLRQFFPETLYWMPELQTDDQGRAQVEVPLADSITTWRASVLVSDRQGNLGSAELGLRVFQDFFVEPDLPRFLTAGDELDVPISVYNYLDEPQAIQLTVKPGDWYEVRGTPDLTFEAGPNAVLAAYLPIRVTQAGTHELELTAQGSKLSDAVLRSVEVLPDGQRAADVTSGRLQPEQVIPAGIPAATLPGTGRVTVKVYPGVVSQVVDGLEGLLQEPYGCFEQTSSTTYPNVMVLNYLERTGQAAPRVQAQAEYLINLGYQRLLTFEVPSEPGGFSLFGDSPAQPMLTAYGVFEFSDMAKVAYVDPNVLARIKDYLTRQQNGDGSWSPTGTTMHGGMEQMTGDEFGRINATAYIVWGLADAGYAEDPTVARGLEYLERTVSQYLSEERPAQSNTGVGSGAPPPNSPLATPARPAAQPEASSPVLSNYTLALVANAYLSTGANAQPVMDALAARAETEDGADGGDGLTHWAAGAETYLGGYGPAADVEATALAAQALLRYGLKPELAAQAVEFLVANRDSQGSFYTTQGTVQALRALVLGTDPGLEQGDATVTVTLTGPDGKAITQAIGVDAANATVVQQVSFDAVAPGSRVAIAVDGDRPLQYQVVSNYYLPWDVALAQAKAQAGAETEAGEPMRVGVTYDRTELAVNDTVDVQATVELLKPGVAGTVIVDLGVPPGFAPVTAELDKLVAEGLVDRYELTGRQIILYLTDVESGKVYTLPYRLQARFPIRAQTPGSAVYDYYAPDQRAAEGPQRMTVTLGTPGD